MRSARELEIFGPRSVDSPDSAGSRVFVEDARSAPSLSAVACLVEGDPVEDEESEEVCPEAPVSAAAIPVPAATTVAQARPAVTASAPNHRLHRGISETELKPAA